MFIFRKQKSKLHQDKNIQESQPDLETVQSHSCLGRVEAMEKFPKLGQHAHLVEAPVYSPTEKEFKDPMKYEKCVHS